MNNITLAPVQPDQPSHLMPVLAVNRSALSEDGVHIFILKMVQSILMP